MPLVRVASGLLFRDDFDRPDGPLGDQYTISGTAGTWAIVGGRAQFTSGRGERMARINIPARQEIYAQVRWAKPGTMMGLGLLCRWDGTTAGGGYLLPHLGGGADDAFALYRRVGSNSYTLIANGSSSMAGATPELGHAHIRDSVQRGWRNGVLLLERADAALDGTDGYLALRGASGTQAGHVGLVEQVVVCTNPRIVCRGLKAGQTINAGGRSAEAGADGVATLDVGGLTLPLASVEVRDSSGATVATFDGEIWGGDEYEFSGGPEPEVPWEPCPPPPAAAWQPSGLLTPGVLGRFWKRPTEALARVVDDSLPPDEMAVFDRIEFSNLAPGGQATNWNVRYLATLIPPATRDYRFRIFHDDGVRIWINGVLVFESWIVQNFLTQFSGPIRLVQGRRYRFQLDYFEGPGPNGLRLEWDRAAPGVYELITDAHLFLPPAPIWEDCSAVLTTSWERC